MIFVIDINVLLRFAHRADPQHTLVRSAIRKIRSRGDQIRRLPQNSVEFWNVCTRRPEQNGFGLSTSQVDYALSLIERIFPLLSDSAETYAVWRNLVIEYSVAGVQVHDARIVAAMMVHRVSHVLTFDTSDFKRYITAGITAIHPESI